ncbi:MAG: hypothetical protein NC402_00580 [Prevotella sp.]|nr:hypothetical protein [Prevotella sp.]MCM1074732.1 hypothetical protein [Ruminococcus sp.]
MVRYIFLFLTLIICYSQAMAEPKEPTAEKIKELQEFKIKYLIQEMDLPAEKQAEFTKLYSQYDKDRSALFHEIFQRVKKMRNNQNPTDTEYMIAAENMATAKAREGDLEQKYFNKLKTILSPKQLYLLKRAEQKFDRKLGEMRGKGSRHKK